MDAGFGELADLGPADRFRQCMEKDCRRYELLVFAVEACYLVLYIIYIAVNFAMAAEKGIEKPLAPKPLPPMLFLILRACRLFGCRLDKVQKSRTCSGIRRSGCSGRWMMDTIFHCVVLSWYGIMAGRFSAMSLSQTRDDRFLKGMYLGPTVFLFLLTVLCLMVLDRLQTLLASVMSFFAFVAPLFLSLSQFVWEEVEPGGDVLQVVSELITLLIATAALCFVRWSSWSDREAHFRREESLKTSIIDEKVKRCHVEFAAQQLTEFIGKQEGEGEESSCVSLAPQESSPLPTVPTRATPSPPSVQSAPSNMDRLSLLQNTSPRSRCDCLPVSAKVHVDGFCGGKPASKLSVGDRVLCYDHLAGSIKFVEVEDCGIIAGPCSWSRVTLTDGTTMSVTTDHPVRIVGEMEAQGGVGGLGGGRVVRAGELRPGNMLKILRMGAVPIEEMQTEPDHQPRVRINLRQSWRYSLFCSEGSGQEMTSVAVESSSGLDGRHEELLQVQNTFLHLTEEASSMVPGRRARSDPGTPVAEEARSVPG